MKFSKKGYTAVSRQFRFYCIIIHHHLSVINIIVLPIPSVCYTPDVIIKIQHNIILYNYYRRSRHYILLYLIKIQNHNNNNNDNNKPKKNIYKKLKTSRTYPAVAETRLAASYGVLSIIYYHFFRNGLKIFLKKLS